MGCFQYQGRLLLGGGRQQLICIYVIGVVVLLNVVFYGPLLVYEATHIVVHLIMVESVVDNSGDEHDCRLEVIACYLWLGLGLKVFVFHVMTSIVVVPVALVVVVVPAVAMVLPWHF